MTESLWNKARRLPLRPLDRDIQTDILVVGSGIGGATAAYLLAKRGRQVVLVTDHGAVEGETSGTTAQINTVHDDGWSEMERLHGVEGTKLCAASYYAALQLIADNVQGEQIDCGFELVPGYLFASPNGGGGEDWLQAELDAARRAGIREIERIDRAPLSQFNTGPCLRYGSQGQFHPIRYVQGLLGALQKNGIAELYGHTHVSELEDGGDTVRVVTARGHTIIANKVVLATNVPMHHRIVPHEAMAAYRSYVIALPVRAGSVELAQYWDNEDPYHYVRLEGAAGTPDGQEILVVGGEDHRVGDVNEGEGAFERLEEWARARFPIVGESKSRWSAQTMETFDGMPLLGRMSGDTNIYIITGDSGTGMTHATIGAMLSTNLIEGGENAWAELYDPSRARTKSLSRWVKENAHSFANYRDWVTPGEVKSVAEIAPGSGAILREGVSKTAVYRDPDGTLHRFSAVCPHLGALVRYNSIENTFDCPAHGSRFTCRGAVVNGPASKCLEESEAPLDPLRAQPRKSDAGEGPQKGR